MCTLSCSSWYQHEKSRNRSRADWAAWQINYKYNSEFLPLPDYCLIQGSLVRTLCCKLLILIKYIFNLIVVAICDAILFYLFLFIFGCVGSSPLCEGFLQLWRVGAALHRGARASHCRGLSCWGAQAPDAQAQQLWLTGLVAPWHVGSSQTRARTRVPCIGRQTLNHCATREALWCHS